MAFFQTPPSLGNQYDTDRVLRSYLARTLPPEVFRAIEPSLQEMGALAGGPLYQKQLADRLNEPTLTQWNAWGQRVDEIEVSPLWKEAAKIAATHGVVGTAYERKHAEHSRVHQFSLVYLFNPSTDVYTCPLAMTDGAARTLIEHGNQALIDRAIPRLTSRDPDTAWTSGQWMTERTGGSDVGLSETVARRGDDGQWRLYGTKWFTSATTSQMALTLGRPEGNPPGGRGLALFYLETRGADGRFNGIQVNRLKDKLGTRKVPTAELTLDGVVAIPVTGTSDGVRNISPMLNITRTWNALCSVSGLRRGLALARDFATKRFAFGAKLSEKPLHLDTIARVQAEFEAAFHLAFFAVELLGRGETGIITDRERELMRLLTPVVKLTTARQAVNGASEIVESFGGAGYVEDTGIPMILRDAQVLSIWEGTTNVLSLDALKSIAKGDALRVFNESVQSFAHAAEGTDAAPLGKLAIETTARATAWAMSNASDMRAIEAGARRFALTLGRSMELALLVRQAAWSLKNERDARPLAAARRFAREGIDLLADLSAVDLDENALLTNDE